MVNSKVIPGPLSPRRGLQSTLHRDMRNTGQNLRPPELSGSAGLPGNPTPSVGRQQGIPCSKHHPKSRPLQVTDEEGTPWALPPRCADRLSLRSGRCGRKKPLGFLPGEGWGRLGCKGKPQNRAFRSKGVISHRFKTSSWEPLCPGAAGGAPRGDPLQASVQLKLPAPAQPASLLVVFTHPNCGTQAKPDVPSCPAG